jgi:hypothetical protein
MQLAVINAFEVLSAVMVKSTVFWDVMPWSPVEFTDIRGTYCLNLRVLLDYFETISFSEIW